MDPGTLQYLLGQAPTAALALIGLWLFGTGKLHSDHELERERRRADTLEAALAEKDKALQAAAARADAAVRASELIADAFTEARRRRGTPGR